VFGVLVWYARFTPRRDGQQAREQIRDDAPTMLPPAQDDATVLFLFMSFGSLVVLVMILVLVGMQTWLLWKVAHAVIEGANVRMEREGVGKMGHGDGAGEWRKSTV
jgi:hypothetical protein